jgi:hypothetical protein
MARNMSDEQDTRGQPTVPLRNLANHSQNVHNAVVEEGIPRTTLLPFFDLFLVSSFLLFRCSIHQFHRRADAATTTPWQNGAGCGGRSQGHDHVPSRRLA